MSGSDPSPPPPSGTTALLARILPQGPVGRSILGDLREEWHRRPAGAKRAWWYRREAAALVLRYGMVAFVSRLAGLGTDAARGVRRLRSTPLVTAFTALALGLGIAAPATMFSIVEGLTRDLPVPAPDSLVHIGRRMTPEVVERAPLEWMRAVPEAVDGLEAVGVFHIVESDLSDDDRFPERRLVAHVSHGVLAALRVDAALGRTFHPADATGSQGVALVGWDLWQTRFQADPGVLGRTVRLDGVSRTVVGVMPPGFAFPDGAELWVPLDPARAASGNGEGYEAVGRLRSGVSWDAVHAQVAALEEGLRADGVEIRPATGLAAEPWSYRRIRPQDRRMLDAMMLLAVFVLLIACGNVTHLLLARGLDRSREDAIRVALGSGRGRIVRQHLAEAVLLALLGGGVGLAVATGAVKLFDRATADLLIWFMDVRLDLEVLAFTGGLVLVAALLTGLLPAIHSRRVAVQAVLRDGGRRTSGFRVGRLGRALVAGELALCTVLLVVAGLMVKGALSNLRSDGTYETRSILAARYELRDDAYPTDEEVLAFHRGLVEEAAAHPDVRSAALTTHLPGLFAARRSIEIEGEAYERPRDRPRTHVVVVSPGFLETMGSGVLVGRDLSWSDGTADARAVLVNAAFVRQHLEGGDPLGRRVRVSYGAAPRDTAEAGTVPWSVVVGVVPPLGVAAGPDADGSAIYLPLSTEPVRGVALLARAREGADPLSLVPRLRGRVRDMDPDLALHSVDSLEGHIAGARIGETVFAALFLSFGGAGLLLASVGLFGLLSFTVRRRVRELGVRSALGATPGRVLWSALRGGTWQLGLGLLLGLGIAAGVAPLLGEALLGSSPRDPLVFGAVIGLLAATGVLAALQPALRTLRIDVVEALRSE